MVLEGFGGDLAEAPLPFLVFLVPFGGAPLGVPEGFDAFLEGFLGPESEKLEAAERSLAPEEEVLEGVGEGGGEHSRSFWGRLIGS